jgi:hypothetical protein
MSRTKFACRVGTDLLIKRPLSQYERSLFLYGSFLLLPVRNSSLAFSENVEPARAWHRRLGGSAIRMSCTYPEADLINRTKWNL